MLAGNRMINTPKNRSGSLRSSCILPDTTKKGQKKRPYKNDEETN